MCPKKIFIGSSTETQDALAVPIAEKLSDKDFQVERWWEVFQAGDITFDKLMRVAKKVDGAVFICKGTDRLWMRNTELNAARDNVILELGMFVMQLGPSRCVVVKDNATHLPTDLNGLTYISLKNDIQTVAEKVAKHFTELFDGQAEVSDQQEQQAFIIETDPYIVNIISGEKLPYNWHTRALFFGTEGARKWLAIARQPDYLTAKQKAEMRRQLASVVDKIKSQDGRSILTFVSLGPGSAEADRELVIHLSRRRKSIQYIPVDISEGLLNYAAHALHSCAKVPFSILSDFEERADFIKERLMGRINTPALFSLLGNTLGNLDLYERTFLRQIQNELMESGDYLLLEVAIITPEWELNKDIRYNLSRHTKEMQNFYAQGLARQIGEGSQSIVNAYPQRIMVREGQSDVEEATSVEYIDSKTRTIIASLRRYDWSSFLSWLRQGEFDFDFVDESSFTFPEGEIGIGAVLLRKN